MVERFITTHVDGRNVEVGMKWVIRTFVIFLLVAGTFVVVAPGRVSAQAETKWTGNLSYELSWITLNFTLSSPLEFSVGSSNQIHGTSSGSAMVSSACGSFPTTCVSYADSALTITGEAYSNGSATLAIHLSVNSNSQTIDYGGAVFSVNLTDGFSKSYSLTPGCDWGVCPPGAPNIPTFVKITLHSESHTTLYCSPYKQLVGYTVNCEADVYGNIPTGTLTLGASSDAVDLGQSQCILRPDLYGPFSTCQFWVRSDVEGNFSVTAHYNGDSNNPPSEHTANLQFVKPEPEVDLALSCNPSVVNGTLQASCTARVSGQLPQPVGSVTWSASNPGGIFSNSTCSLSQGGCGETYFQGNASTAATVTAKYSGDMYHLPKQASATISVLGVGTTILDQRQSSGFLIKVTGTSSSTVDATSTYYYTQPNDTGKAPFSSNEYYDLRVVGAVNGTIHICHYGADVNASTSLDYYYGGKWSTAMDVVATAGMSVCGDIPASTLSGTPLDIGGTSGSVSTTSSTSAASTTTTRSQSSTTSSTMSSSTAAGGGGIPEFPYQLLALSAFIVLLSASYLVVRRRRMPHGPKGHSATGLR